MVVFDTGGGGGSSDPIIVYTSNEGSTSDTSVVTGSYSGSQAQVVANHAPNVEKVGPVFRIYDPVLTNLLAMNF